MNNYDTKSWSTHTHDFRASDYPQIKVQEISRERSLGESVAEPTQFGWVIMAPWNVIDLNNLMVSRTSIDEYGELYNLDVLGVPDGQKSHEDIVHNIFKQQLRQSKEGLYGTRKHNRENL